MWVTKLSGHGFNQTLDRFEKGGYLIFGNASFCLTDKDTVQCNFQTRWNPEFLDRETIQKDINAARAIFELLKENSIRFEEIVKDRTLEVILFDECGSASKTIAVSRNDRISYTKARSSERATAIA